MSGLSRAPDIKSRCPGHVRAGTFVCPRRGVQSVPDGYGQQLVPGRMELHLVDAVPETVMGAQDRRVLVGLAALLLHLRRAGQTAEFPHGVLGPGGALAAQRAQHGRVLSDVVPAQRGSLVENLVRRRHQRFLPRGCLYLLSGQELRCTGLFAIETR